MTEKWEEASLTNCIGERTTAHDRAEEIRQTYRDDDEVGSAEGYTVRITTVKKSNRKKDSDDFEIEYKISEEIDYAYGLNLEVNNNELEEIYHKLIEDMRVGNENSISVNEGTSQDGLDLFGYPNEFGTIDFDAIDENDIVVDNVGGVDIENMKYQLFNDYSILGGLTFISENIIHDAVMYGDEVYLSLKGIDSGLVPFFKYGGKAAPFVSIALDGRALVTEEVSGKSLVHVNSMYYALMGPYGVIPAAKNVAISGMYNNMSEEDREICDWAMSTRGFSDTVTMPPDMYIDALEQLGDIIDDWRK